MRQHLIRPRTAAVLAAVADTVGEVATLVGEALLPDILVEVGARTVQPLPHAAQALIRGKGM